ncbi:WAT1-related protein At1g68170-like isoform X2 [Mangifera indica]|uniref:WAT1-related protein At1g68170-like isoform X2 n=1 Tax=Mangifera indica TaxID=29780 RepID=UPI001CFBE8EF|nr:WAT1-related protein At1g68170-like isoform X2 [Mangifera indica]
MDRFFSFIKDTRPILLMLVVQVLCTGGTVLYKLAEVDGMSVSVITSYRFIFSTAFIVPVALIVERKSRPQLNLRILFKAFLCSLFGLEKVAGIGGLAKVVGTFIGIGGATILTFLKGVEIKLWSTQINLLHHHALEPSKSANNRTLFGCLLSLLCTFVYSMGLIIQAKMSEEYPCKYSSIALVSVMAAMESVVFALSTEKDWSQWKLGLNIRLLTVTYTGIISTGLMMTLSYWCVRMRGALFVSSFNPLWLALVALAGTLVLEERLYVGSVIGVTLIVCGLYVVLWGKAKELQEKTQLIPSKNSGESKSTEIVVHSPVAFTTKDNINQKV